MTDKTESPSAGAKSKPREDEEPWQVEACDLLSLAERAGRSGEWQRAWAMAQRASRLIAFNELNREV